MSRSPTSRSSRLVTVVADSLSTDSKLDRSTTISIEAHLDTEGAAATGRLRPTHAGRSSAAIALVAKADRDARLSNARQGGRVRPLD